MEVELSTSMVVHGRIFGGQVIGNSLKPNAMPKNFHALRSIYLHIVISVVVEHFDPENNGSKLIVFLQQMGRTRLTKPSQVKTLRVTFSVLLFHSFAKNISAAPIVLIPDFKASMFAVLGLPLRKNFYALRKPMVAFT